MNGAIDELWARMISTPRSRRVPTMGISHQSFTAHRNANSSRAIENLARRVVSIVSPSFLDDVVAQDQGVHAAATEGAERLRRGVDDGLPLEVEGGVEQDRHPGRLPKGLDQPMIAGRLDLIHRLEPGGAVHVGDARNARAHRLLDG